MDLLSAINNYLRKLVKEKKNDSNTRKDYRGIKEK